MPYRVIEVESGSFVRSLITELPYEFDTGDEANRFSKDLASDTGGKYRVKKVLNSEWRKREQQRMDNGYYEPLPWFGAEWWHDRNSEAIWRHQYPHPSKKEPGKIAYIESEEKGMDNIKTRVKPGRYLEQFRDILKLYRLDLQREAARFTVLYETRVLRIAETADEIQWVYENGPPSCMSTYEYRKEHGWGWGMKGSWPLNTHATRVYAAGDLAVAYIVTDEDEPKKKKGVLARALIWPAKKTYSRPYGEELALRKLLEKEGYITAAPIGAKLARVEIEKHRFLCPYVDAGQQSGGGALGVLDRKTHLEIVAHRTPFSMCANSTSGATGPILDARGAEAVPRVCHHCHSDCLDAAQVFTSGTDYLWYCGDCRANRTRQCGSDGRFYDTNYMTFVEMADGRFWSQRAFNSRGFMCQATEKRYPREVAVKLITGELWCLDYANDHAQRCMYTNNWDRKENMVKVYDYAHREMWFCKDAAKAYTFTCAVCQEHQWDTGIWNGGAEKNGPLVCKPCQRKATPAGKAAMKALKITDDSGPVPAPSSHIPPPGDPVWTHYTVREGQIMTVPDYHARYGEMPAQHFSSNDLIRMGYGGVVPAYAQPVYTVQEPSQYHVDAIQEAGMVPNQAWYTRTVGIPATQAPVAARPAPVAAEPPSAETQAEYRALEADFRRHLQRMRNPE